MFMIISFSQVGIRPKHIAEIPTTASAGPTWQLLVNIEYNVNHVNILVMIKPLYSWKKASNQDNKLNILRAYTYT